MVSLVLVAHSDPLLTALVAVVRDVTRASPPTFTAGGTDDGRFGTSLARIRRALRAGLDASDDGCLVLYDTGSAWLTLGLAMDELNHEERSLVLLSDAPLVEGALAAAARASDGAALGEVADAAAGAITSDKRPRTETPAAAARQPAT
jgi:dihydroxyacetone kinase DhaKLM complex PTS-EIIA-like component DhaM